MKTELSTLALPVLLSFFFLTGCGGSDPDSANSSNRREISEAEIELRSKWKQRQVRDRHHNKEVAGEILKLAFADDIETLESRYQQYRSEGGHTKSGDRKLVAFYSVFDQYSDWNQVDPERYYGDLETMLKKWMETYPESPGPIVALAALYTNWAWHWRSAKWASEVNNKQWEGFRDSLAKASDVLTTYEEVGKEDGQFHRIKLKVGLGQAWPLEKMQATFDSSQKIVPDYWGSYYAVCYFLLPRWYGENESDWHDWLVNELGNASEKVDSTRLDEIYAQVCVALHNVAYNGRDEPRMTEVIDIDWERLKRGANSWMTRFPQASRLPSRYLLTAMYAGDFPEAKKIVESMNFEYDGWEWWGKDDPQFFGILEFLQNWTEESDQGENPE